MGRALVARPLQPHAPHVFTTRDVTFRGDGEADAWRALGASLGAPPQAIVRVRQVHGRAVLIVADERNAPGGTGGEGLPEADAVIVGIPGAAAAVAVADCVPILIADRGRRVVAAVHAGWRGTAAGIARATVEAIAARGIRPADLVAAIGPSIGPCCYQVRDDVRGALLAATPDAAAWFAEDGPGQWKLDLWRANADELEASGVAAGAIHIARLCTAHHPETFFSYRRDGAGTGRLVAAIRT